MKRLCAIAVVLVALLATATGASAAVAKGKFRGETSKGDPMGLRVTADGLLADLFLVKVRMKCNDGYSFNTPKKKKKRIKRKGVFSAINEDGSWNANDDAWDPWGVYIDNGQFTKNGNKTTGEVEVRTSMSADHKKKGGFDRPVFCTSGPLTFELKRQQ